MNEKGIVKRDDSMRTHVYQAAVNKEKTQKHLLSKMIDNLFGGSPTQLVIQALGEEITKQVLRNWKKSRHYWIILKNKAHESMGQSNFLQALGWAVLNSLWQMALFG